MQSNILHEKQFPSATALSWFLKKEIAGKSSLIDWVVIEFFTDPSLFIRRRITPQLQRRSPLQAAFTPDSWADCSCFLHSHMTCYCHHLIPPLSHHPVTHWNGWGTSTSCLSGSVASILSFHFINVYPSILRRLALLVAAEWIKSPLPLVVLIPSIHYLVLFVP